MSDTIVRVIEGLEGSYVVDSACVDQANVGQHHSLSYFCNLAVTFHDADPSYRVSVNITSPSTITGILTVPSFVTLKFTGGGLLQVAHDAILTIDGPFEAPVHQIFDCIDDEGLQYDEVDYDFTVAGRVKFSYGRTIYPEWFGSGAPWNNPIELAMYCFTSTTLSKTVAFTQSFYEVNRSIHMQDNVTWKGNKSVIQMIAWDDARNTYVDPAVELGLDLVDGNNDHMYYSYPIVSAWSKSNIEVSGMVFDANSANAASANVYYLGYPFRINSCFMGHEQSININLHHNTFKNAWYGITLSGRNPIDSTSPSRACRIEHNFFENVNTGCCTYGSGYTVSNNIFEMGVTGGAAISSEANMGGWDPDHIESGTGFQTTNDADWCTTYPGYMSIDCQICNNIIRGNETAHTGIAILHRHAGLLITGNIISNVMYCGISVTQPNANPIPSSVPEHFQQLNISNNIIRNVIYTGAQADGGLNLIGRGIAILPRAQEALYTDPTAVGYVTDLILKDNIIEYVEVGMTIYRTRNSIVSGNIINHTRRGAYTIYYNQHTKFTNNMSYNFGDNLADIDKVCWYFGNNDAIVVTDNYVRSDATAAVGYLFSADNSDIVTVSGNIALGCTTAVIRGDPQPEADVTEAVAYGGIAKGADLIDPDVGGGDLLIQFNHGLSFTPKFVICSSNYTGHILSVPYFNATVVQVRVTTHAGEIVPVANFNGGGTDESGKIYWTAG
jgi:hypothetical protein